jgi:WhiB family redox-sensing transcriptional regulator
VIFTRETRAAVSEAEWQLGAHCRGMPTDVFYPTDHERGRARRARELHAKQICMSCQVLDPCRRSAITAQEPYGVWGATTPDERVRHLRGTRVMLKRSRDRF